ncbi:GNAT family N-acetyltransferase [Dermacoccaceae bacterium W4C1]
MNPVPVDAMSDDPIQRELFTGMVRVQNDSGAALFGDQHSGWTLDEVLARRRGADWSFADRAVELDGRVVGMAALAMPLRDNTSLAMLMLHVDPEYRRRGVGSALLESGLAAAAESGRTTVQADTEWTADGSDDAGTAFARPRGFVEAQTTVRSAMPLPVPRERLTALADGVGIEDAAAFAIEATWGMPPDEWLPELAQLKQRMSTDAPLGDTSGEEEDWDVERVAADLQWALDVGRRSLMVVARDLSTGGLVGFTYLHVTEAQDPTLAYQQDTLVLAEARGHRLGLRMKAAAALELMDEAPAVTRVRTWNAQENEPMLAVNRALGYQVEGYQRIWERRG